MISECASPDCSIEEWMDTLVSICLSLEVSDLVEQLDEQDHAFPQTVIQTVEN